MKHKRLAALLLALLLLCSLLPAASAEELPAETPAAEEVVAAEVESAAEVEEPQAGVPDEPLPEADAEADTVLVRFLCEPAELLLSVENEEGESFPVIGGKALLPPGYYYYTAFCRGYTASEGAMLYVAPGTEEQSVRVLLDREGECITTHKGEGCCVPQWEGEAPVGAGARVLEGGRRDFLWPAPPSRGLSSCFLDGRRHHAIDICGGEAGSAIVASYDGTVCEVGYAGGYGNYVMLRHDYTLADGSVIPLYSKYNHLASYAVAQGQSVRAGEIIAGIGCSGGDYPVHLDYQILSSAAWGNYNYHNISLDPYVNELLELPDDIFVASTPACCGVGPTGCCCKLYLDYIREAVYSQPVADGSYLDSCTLYASLLDVALKEDAALYSLPTANAAHSAALELLPEGETLSVTGLWKNAAGELWYEAQAGDGTRGYLPCARCAVTDDHAEEITAGMGYSGKDFPETLPLGQGYSVNWVVSSSALALSEVCGALYTEDEVSSSGHVTGLAAESFPLRHSAVDLNLTFGTLGEGWHRMAVSLRADNHYSADGSTLSSFVTEKTVIDFRFWITPAGHTHSFTDSVIAPGCAEAGYTEHRCACGYYTRSDELPALGHDWGAWEPVSGTAEEEHICARCGEVERHARAAAVLCSRSLSLDGDIGVQFYLSIPEEYLSLDGAYAVAGQSVTLLSEAPSRKIDGQTHYRFSAPVSAKEMNDRQLLRLFEPSGEAIPLLGMKGEDLTASGVAFSVQDYIALALQQEGWEDLKPLLHAMSDYGSCAQAFFNYDTASRAAVSADLSAVTAESVSEYAPVISFTGDEGLSYRAMTLELESETSLRLYFSPKNGASASDYRFVLDGTEQQTYARGADIYVLIPDIAAKDLDARHTLCVRNAQGEDLGSLEVCALSYATLALTKGTGESLRELVCALVLYARAAEAYFA